MKYHYFAYYRFGGRKEGFGRLDLYRNYPITDIEHISNIEDAIVTHLNKNGHMIEKDTLRVCNFILLRTERNTHRKPGKRYVSQDSVVRPRL